MNTNLLSNTQGRLDQQMQDEKKMMTSKEYRVETDGAVDINDLTNTSMTEVLQSGYGANTSAKQKSKLENSANKKIKIDYNH